MKIGDRVIGKGAGYTSMLGFIKDRTMSNNETGIIIGLTDKKVAIKADIDNATLVRSISCVKLVETLRPEIINDYQIY